ncbi:MAG: LamG-like jellyroll fold domain-containing protein [Pseudomonadota bacterium]
MTAFFGENYVTEINDLVFDPSGGQFGPDVTGFNYSEFFGVGEDDLVGGSFSIGGPVNIDLPFVGETEIFRARLYGELGAQFGLQINSSLDPGSVDAILPYETVVAYPDFDLSAIAQGDVVDLYFGATFEPEADPDSGFTTKFPSFTFEIGIVTELLVELAAEIGVLGENATLNILDFVVPETFLPIFSLDTDREITAQQEADDPSLSEGDFNPIELFGVTTPELINEIDGIDPAYDDAGDLAGISIPLNNFASDPDSDDAEKTDASPEGEETPEDDGPGFDLTAIDLGRIEIFVPKINTVSSFVDGVFVTDPTKKAEYNFDTDGNLLSIDRVDDLDEDGNNLGEGNRDDLARLTLDLDGLITYATGGTFPPLELDVDILDGSVAGINLDAGFSYNLLDVELEAALPLEQEFTLTPKLQTQLKFFESDGNGGKVETAKPVEVQMEQKVLLFDETGIFQDDAITARLRELADSNSLFAQDIDAFLDLDQGIVGAFTGQTASIGGRMIISRDGGRTWEELFTNASDPIAENAPSLGQDQTLPLTLDEDTLLGYRLFIGSGSTEVREDYVIEFDKTDSVYVEEIIDTSSFISETPFLDDLTALNVVYDDAETFVEVVSRAIPYVTNRTGLEFDLALILRGLAASANFGASIDIGPFTIGAGLEFELGPLFEEKFELLNLDIVDLFNDGFQLEDRETTTFVLGAPAPETDFGDAIVGTSGNDTLQGTPEADEIVALSGEDTVNAGAGNDTIFLGNGADSVDGGAGFDTLDLSELQGGIRTSNLTSNFGTVQLVRVATGQREGVFAEPLIFGGSSGVTPRGDVLVVESDDEDLPGSPRVHEAINVERAVFTDLGDTIFATNDQGVQFFEARGGNDYIQAMILSAIPIEPITVLAGTGDDVVDTAFRIPAAGSHFDGGEGYDYIVTDDDLDLVEGIGNRGEIYVGFEAVAAHLSTTGSHTFRGDAAGNSLLGGAGNDTLDGREGNDFLFGGDDDDLLIGGAGADGLYGGAGLDTADYSTAATSVFVDLDFGGVGRGFRGDAQGDTLESVEVVIGSDFEDILFGDNAANTLIGGLGDDRLQSDDGDDLLEGGADNDLLNRGDKASLGGSFNNTYDGGDGFDIVAVDVFDEFQQTGSRTGTATFTYKTGTRPFDSDTNDTENVTISHRYQRTAHMELALEEDGSGTIFYVEDDASARFLATNISGTAKYSSLNFLDITWDIRSSSYNNDIDDQSLANLQNDSISFTKGNFEATDGTGRITNTGGLPSTIQGGAFGSEQVLNIEGVIGSDGDDAIIGNSEDNALFGNGGWDAILGGAGNDRIGFGAAQSLSDAFSFPSSSGGGSAPVIGYPSFTDRLAFLDPDETTGEIVRTNDRGSSTVRSLIQVEREGVNFPITSLAPSGKINVGFNTQAQIVTVGSFLWGGAGTDTLDMRFDRGLDFFPDVSTNYARVRLEIPLTDAPINIFTNETVFYGVAEWFNAAGVRQSFASTYGIENVIGSRRDDEITGDRKDNTIEGMDGADVLDGAEGFDTASYTLAKEAVTLNFRGEGTGFVMDNARATITGTGDATGDIAENFERYLGSDHDDTAIVEGGAIVGANEFVANVILPQIGSTPITVTGATYSADNLVSTLELDMGAGNDDVVLEGRGAHDVALGDGDDLAVIRNIGHTIDAGIGNDVITVLDHEDLSLAELDPTERVTTIDGGEGEDVVVFAGGDYVALEITDQGAVVTERLDPAFAPESQTFDISPIGEVTVDLTQTPEFQAEQQAAREALAVYELTNVEIVEINGERVRINNPDPILDPDRTLTLGEDQIDTYDLDLNISQIDIDAGATYEILALPQTAALVTAGGAPVLAGDVLAADVMAELQVVPGQNFDPARDTLNYLKVGDPPEEEQTKALPEPIRGVALNITSHLEEKEVDISPPAEPEAEIALVRLNPAPVVGDGPTVDELDYAIGSEFADMPTGALTFEMLFRSAGEYDPGIITTFLSYATSGDQNEFLIEDARDGNGLRILFAGTTIATGWRVDQLFDREVHRLSLVIDTDGDEVELFVDGILVFAAEVPGISALAAGGTFTFGQEQDSVGGNFSAIQTTKGDIGDIRIWDGVRTEAEIADTAFSEIEDLAAEANLNAYWQADIANQGVMVNAVGDTHLKLINGPEIVTTPEPEAPSVEVIPTIRMNVGSITNEGVQAGSFAAMPSGPMTIEFVYQSPEGFDASGGRQHLLSYAVQGSTNEFLLFADQSSNSGQIGLILNSAQTIITDAPSSLLLDTEPHRLSILFDPDADTLQIYIDGVLAGGASVAMDPIAAGGSLIFGQEQDAVGGGFNPNESIAGDYGDIRIWDALRTESEILTNAFTQISDPAAEADLVANWQVDLEDSVRVPNLAGTPDMIQFGSPLRGSVQFDLPSAPQPIGPPIVAETQTIVVDQQGDPVTITVDEVPANGTVFYMAPDPTLLTMGITYLVEMPVDVGDELTPAMLEGLYFRADTDFNGDAGTFSYTVRDDVSFRQLTTTLDADTNGATDGDIRDGAASQRIGFDVIPVNDAPKVANVLFPVSPGGKIESTVRVTDPEGDGFTVSLIEQPEFGTVDLNADGSFTYHQVRPIDFAGASSVEDLIKVRVTENSANPPAEFAFSEDGEEIFEQTVRIINPAFQSDIVFDPLDPDYFEEDGTPINLGGLGTDDTLKGHDGPDGLFGFGGADLLFGLPGNDTLTGGVGNDTLRGNKGDDVLYGGEDDDQLFGNEANDVQYGGDGADKIYGGSGDDMLAGDAGADALYGGGGIDTADYSGSGAKIVVRLSGSPGSGGDAQGDRLFDVENIIGSAFDDTLIGDGLGNTIDGLGGMDSIVGSADVDILKGGVSGDQIRGNAGDDEIHGDEGNDRLFGDEDEDMIFGGADNDRVFGGGDNDTIDGGAGADSLFGTLGADLIYGGGDDDFIAGNAGADVLYGGTGEDTINGNEFADVLYGGAQDDVLNGGTGVDELFGGGGDDILNGGASSDQLTGDGGADTFQFTATGGIDRITDWQDGIDSLDFTADGLGFADFTVSTFGGGAGAKIVGGGYVVFFEGVATNDIDSTDFL